MCFGILLFKFVDHCTKNFKLRWEFALFLSTVFKAFPGTKVLAKWIIIEILRLWEILQLCVAISQRNKEYEDCELVNCLRVESLGQSGAHVAMTQKRIARYLITWKNSKSKFRLHNEIVQDCKKLSGQKKENFESSFSLMNPDSGCMFLQVGSIEGAIHGEAKLKTYMGLLKVLITREMQSMQEACTSVLEVPISQVCLIIF